MRRSFKALLLAVFVCLMAPTNATAQLSSVTVTVDSIVNKGCFDRFLFFCSKPELTLRVGLRQRDGTIVRCRDSAPATNLDNVSGPIASCMNTRVEAPFDLVVSIADADESKLPVIAIQELGRLSSAPSGDAVVPWFRLGSGNVSISGPDADVALRIAIQPVRPTFWAAALRLDRNSIDPALGDEIHATADIVEWPDGPNYATGTRVRFAAVARATGTVIALGEGVFGQRIDVTWNGRDGAAAMPPGSYAMRATLLQTGEMVESADFTIAAAPPGLEMAPLSNWNARAGPVEVGYRLTRAGTISARLFGPAPADSPPDACTEMNLPAAAAPHAWTSPAGNHTQGVPLRAANGQFLAEGRYCMRLQSAGGNAARQLRVRNAPPLFLAVSAQPVLPALAPGAPVFVEARAHDEERRPRPTGRITVTARLTDVGLPMPSVTATCQNVSRCRVAIPPAMAMPEVIALLVFEADAADLPNPGNADPQAASARLAPRGTSVGPTLGRGFGAISIPVEGDAASGFMAIERRRTIDVAVHPGTGFDLSIPASRTQFVEVIDRSMKLMFGEFPIVGATSITAAPDAFAFWFSNRSAVISAYVDDDDVLCRRDAVDALPFAEVQGVVHLVDCRDTADGAGATFSVLADRPGSAAHTFWHEMHHAAFDLADEYADDGGYFQTFDLPNVMTSLAECRRWGAEPALCEQIGALEEDDCTAKGTKVEDCPVRKVAWWRAGPRPDVMILNTVQNADDRRRANFVIEKCRRRQC